VNFRDYNDYEIIDSIKQGNEEALTLMVEKYRYLIAKKIIKFNLISEFDDYYQEGLMVLYRSVLKFEDRYLKTFTRFFELNYERHLITAIRTRQRKQRFITEKLPMFYDDAVQEARVDYYSECEIKSVLKDLSGLEKTIFERRFIQNQEVKKIAELENIEVKTVYNAIERIRKKIKLHLDT